MFCFCQEVDLPSISGYSLLTLIMEHDICKNIPVLMMSSNDSVSTVYRCMLKGSVSTVYRCMLKGAADFLVKPVKKNELNNLGQHVWRTRSASEVPRSLLMKVLHNQRLRPQLKTMLAATIPVVIRLAFRETGNALRNQVMLRAHAQSQSWRMKKIMQKTYWNLLNQIGMHLFQMLQSWRWNYFTKQVID
ncbi:uncharacterized protein LOC107867402 [Capsicum annuum]|uniref:uncharacterized protein LOC107867402 n=1 Tax=Capsicum annuum TaxID=4072 RepID=UPI0007BFD496|nr:uncharacterized protein LOC107867402 [Capsicum annuum]XP_047262537.1 uncharacterized protein LOC107867402 [Capsicum annuum]